MEVSQLEQEIEHMKARSVPRKASTLGPPCLASTRLASSMAASTCRPPLCAIREADLLDAKRQEEEQHIRSKKDKRAVDRSLAEEQATGARLAEEMAAVEAATKKAESAAAAAVEAASAASLQLRMLEREFVFLGEAVGVPDKVCDFCLHSLFAQSLFAQVSLHKVSVVHRLRDYEP